MEQRAFPRAGGAHHGGELAARDLQRHARERGHLAAALRVAFPRVDQTDHAPPPRRICGAHNSVAPPCRSAASARARLSFVGSTSDARSTPRCAAPEGSTFPKPVRQSLIAPISPPCCNL